MIAERVADNVYVFTSEVYAQVNAGAVIGTEWSVLIDTLALPHETREIKVFIEERLETPVRYVINTHHHSDHTNGNYLFPGATVLGHRLCRELMDTLGRERLEEARQQSKELREVDIVLPSVVFEDGSLQVRVGSRVLKMISLPGHTPDGLGVLVLGDKVLFSGDAMMPVPYVADGDVDLMIETLTKIPHLSLESLVQGHGGVVLRGEVEEVARDSINYIVKIRKEVKKASRRREPEAYLAGIDIESCGKSRILLNGLAEDIHQLNLRSLYQKEYGEA